MLMGNFSSEFIMHLFSTARCVARSDLWLRMHIVDVVRRKSPEVEVCLQVRTISSFGKETQVVGLYQAVTQCVKANQSAVIYIRKQKFDTLSATRHTTSHR